MTGQTCAVAMCKNSYYKAKRDKENIVFFRFPTDPDVRKKWVQRCYRQQRFNPDTSKICCAHFTKEDYDVTMKDRLMNLTPKRLKKTAVPSLNLKPGLSDEPTETAIRRKERYEQKLAEQQRKEIIKELLESAASEEQEQRMAEQQRKEIIKELLGAETSEEPTGAQDRNDIIKSLLEDDSISASLEIETEGSSNGNEFSSNINESDINELPSRSKNLQLDVYKPRCEQPQSEVSSSINELPSTSKESELDVYKRQCQQLRLQNKELQTKLAELTQSNTMLQQRISNLEQRKEQLDSDKVKSLLSQVFTPNEIDILLKDKLRVRWTEEEIAKAFTLRFFSKRCYIYMRYTLNYPLPGLSTLHRWAANINLRCGVLGEVLYLMDILGKTKKAVDRVTVLSYNEVEVAPMYEYDDKFDEVVGPHSHMQVIMARGLHSDWKQPVFISLDTTITKDVLFNVISRLHAIKYSVVAYVSDCSAENQAMWDELNIDITNTSFQHPDTLDPVYVLVDPSHLLKLIRNQLLDGGFTSSGTKLDVTPLKRLLDLSKMETDICPEFTDLHITCTGLHRQNVQLAAELFSQSVAVALREYINVPPHVSHFIEKVSKWFDVFNSQSIFETAPSKQAYGKHLDSQNQVLNNVIELFTNLQCDDEAALHVLQTALVISSCSLEGLLEHLQAKSKNWKYILTHRLHRDCIEDLFSQSENGSGFYEPPSPLTALYCIRLIVLGKRPVIRNDASSETTPENTQYLVATALKKARVTEMDVAGPPTHEMQEVLLTITEDEPAEATEDDSLVRLAGYLAKKFKKEYPHLGVACISTDDHSYSTNEQDQPSFEELVSLTPGWTRLVRTMNAHFQEIHATEFLRGPRVAARTVRLLTKKCPSIPMKIVREFSKQRMLIRVKYLNVRQNLGGKRSLDSLDIESESVHKRQRTVL